MSDDHTKPWAAIEYNSTGQRTGLEEEERARSITRMRKRQRKKTGLLALASDEEDSPDSSSCRSDEHVVRCNGCFLIAVNLAATAEDKVCVCTFSFCCVPSFVVQVLLCCSLFLLSPLEVVMHWAS